MTPIASKDEYDVVVVGGGAAGLSGATALVRSRRSVLVVDDGTPRNARAAGVHNFLSRDGTAPAELLAAGRAEVTGYGGEVVDCRVVGAEPVDGGFRVSLADGSTVRTRRLLVTTGLADELPDVPGLAQRWGRDVLHCPYCHGWEVRDRRIGVLASSPLVMHQALLFRQLSEHITVFLRGTALDDDAREQLDARGVTVVDGEVAGLEVTDDALTGVRLGSGEVVACDALAVQAAAVARTELLAPLGLAPTDFAMGDLVLGSYLAADPTGATAVPGLYVAGNVADIQAQVVSAAAAGLKTGAMINADLVAEDTRVAVAAHRERTVAHV